MITIRLLGGAKKALGGKGLIELDKPRATVLDILGYLQTISSNPQLLNSANLIVAINGIDAVAMQGTETIATNGDTVTVVTVVHGGTFALEDGTHAEIIGIKKISTDDVGEFLDMLRKEYKSLCIQAVSAESVYGMEHAIGVLSIVLEAKKRGILIANKIETELLLRLACTGQISEAISRAGLKNGASACFIALSDKLAKIKRFRSSLYDSFQVDQSVLGPSPRKKRLLAERTGISQQAGGDELLNYLLESAAILIK